ncbi:MAG: transposase [Pseudomonadales bacterium]
MARRLPDRMSGDGEYSYTRHKPEETLLYQIIERYWPEFQLHLSERGSFLPYHVTREYEQFLLCGRLEQGFFRIACETCHLEKLLAFSCKKRGFCPSCGARRMAETSALLVDDVLPHRPIRQWVLSLPLPLRFLLAHNPQVIEKVLGIVIQVITDHLIKKSGLKKSKAQSGAVTLIQRSGSALNLNYHFHTLFIDGVFEQKENSELRFHRVNAATKKELNLMALLISHRVGDCLEGQGLLTRDEENSYLSLDLDDEDAMNALQGHSITYRIAVGPYQGRKVFTLQTIPGWEEDDLGSNQVGKVAGFSLHAGVATKTRERKKLEKLCRYISRPTLSEKRLSLTEQGRVKYQLKTPFTDGTTHIIFEPLDFLAKLAALVPKPRINLTRYHGIFAPNSNLRPQVVPSKRGKGSTHSDTGQKLDRADKRHEMSWAERLKRVFKIDISICTRCGGSVRIIACIEDPIVIKRILDHIDAKKGMLRSKSQLPEPRAPPQIRLFDYELE